jgi:ABC-type nitrate/sulfonate/bicarbonate transport system substrate-binding protein
MSHVIDNPETTVSIPTATKVEAVYTICPVLVASNVAAELGWLQEETKRAGAQLTYLRGRTDKNGWLEHYSHQLPNLFRDGGNSPAVWAKADLRDTVLLGLTQAQPAGKIIVRADSGIYTLRELKGRRIALYRSRLEGKIDHRRATSEHGILAALQLHGLGRDDVQIVDIDDADTHVGPTTANPAETWALRRLGSIQAGAEFGIEAGALLDGTVDAIYDYGIGNAERLEATGKFKVIEDLDRYPDWTLKIANAPRTITVSAEFAREHRDIVVAYLRAAIRAGRWINGNPGAAADIFRRVTLYPSATAIAKALPNYDLVPNLSAQNLAGLNIEKDFLLARGYIRNDFDIAKWADVSYLQEAHASL